MGFAAFIFHVQPRIGPIQVAAAGRVRVHERRLPAQRDGVVEGWRGQTVAAAGAGEGQEQRHHGLHGGRGVFGDEPCGLEGGGGSGQAESGSIGDDGVRAGDGAAFGLMGEARAGGVEEAIRAAHLRADHGQLGHSIVSGNLEEGELGAGDEDMVRQRDERAGRQRPGGVVSANALRTGAHRSGGKEQVKREVCGEGDGQGRQFFQEVGSQRDRGICQLRPPGFRQGGAIAREGTPKPPGALVADDDAHGASVPSVPSVRQLRLRAGAGETIAYFRN